VARVRDNRPREDASVEADADPGFGESNASLGVQPVENRNETQSRLGIPYTHPMPLGMGAVARARARLSGPNASQATEIVSRRLGISNTIATIPGVLGVTLGGAILDATGSWALVFGVAGAFSVIGLVAFAAMGRRRAHRRLAELRVHPGVDERVKQSGLHRR
jgi:MFS family permease